MQHMLRHDQMDAAAFGTDAVSPAFKCYDCLQATVAATTCTIIADAANKDEIEARIKQIKKELSETDSVYDTEKLSERIAKLAGGVAVIKVSLLVEAICWALLRC